MHENSQHLVAHLLHGQRSGGPIEGSSGIFLSVALLYHVFDALCHVFGQMLAHVLAVRRRDADVDSFGQVYRRELPVFLFLEDGAQRIDVESAHVERQQAQLRFAEDLNAFEFAQLLGCAFGGLAHRQSIVHVLLPADVGHDVPGA